MLTSLNAQEEGNNLVANSSFEKFSAVPIGWFKKGEHYTRVMKYWESPTSASPDIFGPRVYVPNYWKKQGFGKQPPHSGQAMSGLTTYGCETKGTHCREYVSIRLNEPLVIGQIYYVEMYVSHLEGAYYSNKLGMHFTKEKVNSKFDEILEREAQFEFSELLDIPNYEWKKISGEFKAKEEADYLIIGNFNTDEQTNFKKSANNTIDYAYYYIDDVLVKKLPPYLSVPIRDDDLTLQEIEEGKTIRLKNIYFDFDSFDLHPRSFVELKKLLYILEEHSTMCIEIIGHTDSIGDDDYNEYLSVNRAKSVMDYLQENAISLKRLEYKGEGESKPIDTNRTEAGRQLNRRVEFKIKKL